MTQNAAPERSTRGLGFTLAVGAAFIILWPLPFIALSLVIHWGAALIIGAIAGFAFGVLVLHPLAPSLYGAAWLVLVSTGLGGVFGHDYVLQASATSATLDAPAQAAEHDEATFLRFTKARVVVDRIGWTAVDAMVGHAEQQSFVAVAAIVGPEWTADDPVAAWALCGTTSRYLGTEDWRQWVLDHCVPGWQSGEGVWRRADAESETRHREAVAAVAESEGFTTSGEAALLSWVADPNRELADAREGTITTLLSCGAAWLILLPMARGVGKRRRKNKKKDKRREGKR